MPESRTFPERIEEKELQIRKLQTAATNLESILDDLNNPVGLDIFDFECDQVSYLDENPIKRSLTQIYRSLITIRGNFRDHINFVTYAIGKDFIEEDDNILDQIECSLSQIPPNQMNYETFISGAKLYQFRNIHEGMSGEEDSEEESLNHLIISESYLRRAINLENLRQEDNEFAGYVLCELAIRNPELKKQKVLSLLTEGIKYIQFRIDDGPFDFEVVNDLVGFQLKLAEYFKDNNRTVYKNLILEAKDNLQLLNDFKKGYASRTIASIEKELE